MRILHVITSLEVGGAEQMLVRLLSVGGLAGAKQAVVALLPGGALGEAARADADCVWELDLLSVGGFARGLSRVARIARDWKPDIVQGWLYQGNLAGLVAARAAGNRCGLVWSMHQTFYPMQKTHWLGWLSLQCCRMFSRLPDRTIYVSEVSLSQHRQRGFPDARAVLIPNGFDLEKFAPDPAVRQAVRDRLGLTEHQVAIAMVARFHPMKDHRGLLVAARAVADRCPQARFVLIGNGLDRTNTRLNEWMKELGLEDVVCLLGLRDDVPSLLKGMDFLVSPSAYGEAFSLAIGEGMASGLVPVVTDVGDSSALAGDCGFVVPPMQPKRLAEALIMATEMGVNERANLARAARDRIARRYSLDSVAASYRNLYDSVGESRTGRPFS